MSSGGPKDHFLRFFWELEVFFKEGHFFATPNWGIQNGAKISCRSRDFKVAVPQTFCHHFPLHKGRVKTLSCSNFEAP